MSDPNRPAYIKDKKEKSKEVNEGPLAAMARELRALKDRKEDLAEQEKQVNKAIDELSIKLAESLESAGVDSFKVTGVGSIRIEEVHRPSVNDKEAFLAWLDARGASESAPRQVHHQRLVSLVKELLEAGLNLPPGVSDFVQKRAAIRRS